MSRPPCRGAAGGDDPRRPRLRRPQTIRLSDEIGLRLCHPVPRRHPRRRRRRRKPGGGRAGRQGRPGAPSARRLGHCRRATGRRRRLCVHAKAMKEPWCLATSKADASAREIVNLYARRWTIEPSFRDTKDLRFGMGLGAVRIGDPQRRDRLLLLNAFAVLFLTLLGEAGEALGMDRHLKVNTAKRRTHSLFRQGCMLYDLIPAMPEPRLRPLIERFLEMLKNKPITAQLTNIA
ncbi:transposase [Defluviicoccus vanus]|uniref:transposase n=1 Tax=Defluviicoccus vanus TaxID=111831 RepID=UPI0038995EE5